MVTAYTLMRYAFFANLSEDFVNKIIPIGERNKNRSTPEKLETGASDKIVKILEEYFDGRM